MSPRFTHLLKRLRLVAPVALVLALLLTVLVASAAAPPNVDTFTDAQATVSATLGVPGSGVVTEPLNAGNILGTQREVYASVSSGPNGLSLIFNGSTMSINTGDFTVGTTTLTYDGATNSNPDPSSVDTTGLCSPSCADLAQGDTTNGFRIIVPSDDTLGSLTVKAWDGVTGNTCARTFTNLFPGNYPLGPTQSYFIEFPSINNGTCSGGPVDFGQVGAVQFAIEGAALDMTIDSIDVAIFDWGDLPEDANTCLTSLQSGYATKDACLGPRHVINGTGTLYLGANVDPASAKLGEFDGQPSTGARGDDNNPIGQPDDEEGVQPVQCGGCTNPTTWQNGANGGRISVTVVGTGYLVGWIDFNGDGFQPTEVVASQSVSSAGSPYTFNFNIPAGTFDANGNATLYARFRLFGSGEVNTFSAPYAFDGRDGFTYFTTQSIPNPNQAKNGEVEDYRWIFSSGTLAVTLADLRAEAQSDHVLVSWETVSELNNQGFNLYRSTSPDAAGQQINPALIPAQAPGSAQGALYTWQDADVTAGVTYYYTLEDVDLSGATTLHGPVSVVFQAPTAVTLEGLTASSNAPVDLMLAAALLALSLVALLLASRRLHGQSR